MNLARRRISAAAICLGVILTVTCVAFPSSYATSPSAPPAAVKAVSKRGLGCVEKITRATIAESLNDMKSIDVRNEGASDLTSRFMQCSWANTEYVEIHKHRFAHTWRVLDSIIIWSTLEVSSDQIERLSYSVLANQSTSQAYAGTSMD